MKNYVEKNQKILDEWRENNENKYGERNFADDGIMFRGKFKDYDGGKERLPDDAEQQENKQWAEAPLRVLFLTKDQNAGGNDAWDVRSETGKLSYAFFRNLMYQLYGLVNTKPEYKPDYTFTNEAAIELYNTFPIARINAKKEAGKSSLNNSTLKDYIERDGEFLQKQIENLDADIIVCCGYSDNVEDTGNLLLNFLKDKCGYKFRKVSEWMYYDYEKNKLAINNWHLSIRKSSETIYKEMMDAYQNFLKEYPTFLNNHRAEHR